jgi:hypothetical protein
LTEILINFLHLGTYPNSQYFTIFLKKFFTNLCYSKFILKKEFLSLTIK